MTTDVTQCRAHGSDGPVPANVASIEGLPTLWAKTLGDPRVCVAILDGPVDLSHPAFTGSNIIILEGHVTASDAAAEHGTHIASVVFGQHDGPIKGIAPRCAGLLVPIFRTGADGAVVPCSQADLATAIKRAVEFANQKEFEALVINISGGQLSQSGEADPVLAHTIAHCDDDKVLIVAAAGNQGCDCLQVPGALPSVLAVGAMKQDGEPLEYSNWGDTYLRQGVLAIGENILGASPSGNTSISSGTSYATPIVAGVAALLLSLQLKRGGRPSAAAVRRAILDSAHGCSTHDSLDCRKLLAGKLSVRAATESLTTGDISDMNQDRIVQPASPLPNDTSVEKSAEQSGSNTQAAGSEHSPLTVRGPEHAVAPSASEPRGHEPSGNCGCGGARSSTPVFALGNLSYDFASIPLRESIRDRMGSNPNIEHDATFMRYLLQVNPDGTGPGELNTAEAERVHWVLEYAGVPQYVIKPGKAATAEGHLSALVYDYLEQQGLANEKGDLNLKADDPLCSPAVRPDLFAIPGVVTGEMAVLVGTGRTVPVLTAEYDLVRSWNLDALISNAVSEGLLPGEAEAEEDFRRFASALQAYVDPKGDTPETRALNFMATAVATFTVAARSHPTARRLGFKGFSRPVRVETKYRESLVYEITAHFFDVANVLNALYSQRFRVDVSMPYPHLESRSDLGFGSAKFIE